MNIHDQEFIKNIIRDDLSTIPNPGFTADTVLKIKASGNPNPVYRVDSYFIYPVLVYAIIVLMTSIMVVFNLIVPQDSISFLKVTLKEISEILFNPVTISICISVTILYFLESYLNRFKSKYFQT